MGIILRNTGRRSWPKGDKSYSLVPALLVVSLLLNQGCGDDTTGANTANEIAPDFTLELFDGGVFKLKVKALERRGSPLVKSQEMLESA